MAFWSSTQAGIDPKRQHRWLISLGTMVNGFGSTATYVCKKINKPKMTITNAEHKFLNHTFNYPGSVTFEPVTATFVDPGDPHTTQTLMEIVKRGGYNLPSDLNDAIGPGPQCATPSKDLSVSNLNGVAIQMLNGNGAVLENTTLHNPWIASIDFGGDLAYDTDGLMEVTMEIRYDWISMEKGDNSLVGGLLNEAGTMIGGAFDKAGGALGGLFD